LGEGLPLCGEGWVVLRGMGWCADGEGCQCVFGGRGMFMLMLVLVDPAVMRAGVADWFCGMVLRS
jgi:hypothetical protein